MKRILLAALALTLLNGTAVMAAPGGQNSGHQNAQEHKAKKGNERGGHSATPATPIRQRIPKHTPPVVEQGVRTHVTPAPHRTPVQQITRRHTMPVARDHAPRSVPIFRDQGHNPVFQSKPNVRTSTPRWTRGDRVPDQYRQKQYYVTDWQQRGLRRPPRGHHWVRDDNNDFFLAVIATGVITTIVSRDDRDQYWNHRYSRTYTYDDDVYYRECRNQPDPGGVLAGAIIGGLLGNAAGHGSSGATVAGVIFGGTMGAALTSNMDCEDRSYAYRTYYDGFNSGRPGSHYDWRNPHNDHHGQFRLGSYYSDPDGFRCARFTQTTYIQGRAYDAQGVACRQPDGSWAVVN